MSDILLFYRRPDPTTWVYMSSFLTIGLFFVFHRFWSIRNVDIVLLILLAPGLLMVHEGRRQQMGQRESQAAARLEAAEKAEDQTAAEENAEEGSAGSGHRGGADIESDAPGDATTPVAGEALAASTDDTSNGVTADRATSDSSMVPDTTGSSEVASGDDPAAYTPRDIQRLGFISLFLIQALILTRLLLDPLMVRRPLLEPNLTIGGLNFIGISLFIFMMANVLNSDPRTQMEQGPALGPGYALMNMLPAIPTRPVSEALGGVSPPAGDELTPSQARLAMIAKILAIVAHMAIVTGIVLIGSRHFGSLRAGVGCATLYLLLPYTAQLTGRVDHAIPAALLLWALLMYRKPFVSGIFIGLAGGLVYYPLFLLPLWFSFYWPRGARRFGGGVASMLALLMLLLSFAGTETLVDHLRRMFGLFSPYKEAAELRGFWELGLNPIWRLPVIVGFVILSVFFAIWPAQKNLGVLVSGSAAIMVSAQFWHGYGGGLYIAWFLPLLLLTIFRPNLQDRVATKVVDGPRVSPLTREKRLEVEAA